MNAKTYHFATGSDKHIFGDSGKGQLVFTEKLEFVVYAERDIDEGADNPIPLTSLSNETLDMARDAILDKTDAKNIHGPILDYLDAHLDLFNSKDELIKHLANETSK